MLLYFSGSVIIRELFGRKLFGFAITLGIITTVTLASAQAQTAQLEATVTATSGAATLINGTTSLSRPLRRDEKLTPGDEIETGARGRVTLKLTDGSLVTIHPNSRVVIKDFRDAPSVRELVHVLAGYVRVKIYHTGKRLNPYRVNTPVASIAVRGTEFGVRVTSTGETRVTVFEGLVEVTSQTNPGQKRLLSPGRSVVVRPSGDIGLFAPGAGSELNAIANYASQPSSLVYGGVQNYADNVVSPASNTPFERFLAFADSHFDSLENPAYAAQFVKPEGRIYLLPSFSGSNLLLVDAINLRSDYSSYSTSEQTTYFLPLKENRLVLGGAFTVVRGHSDSIWTHNLIEGDPPIKESGDLNLTTINWSIIAARRFGTNQRLSLGAQFDHLRGHTDGETSTPTYSFFNGSFFNGYYIGNSQNIYKNQVRRSRITVGLARDFSEDRKLGIFYRYGIGSTDTRHALVSTPANDFYEGTTSLVSARTRSSEIGVRWRSPLIRRLYYGLHSSILFDKTITTFDSNPGNSTDRYSGRALFGGGLGYEISRHTTIAFDVAGGAFRRSYEYDYKGVQDFLPKSMHTKSRFITLHTGGQTDLGRRFFVNGSLFWERTRILDDSPFDLGISSLSGAVYWKTIANLGPGWRIRQNIYAQYIFSWGSNSANKSHSIMLRYNFGSGKQ